jgi:hypothetical protein
MRPVPGLGGSALGPDGDTMTSADLLGWTAAALMVCTFVCRQARAMRPLAVATNLAFIGYGVTASLPPVLALHALLLPINLWRWSECLGARQPRTARGWLRWPAGALAACALLLLAGCSVTGALSGPGALGVARDGVVGVGRLGTRAGAGVTLAAVVDRQPR